MDADRLTPFSIAGMEDEAALVELLKRALSLRASDLFILPGAPVTVKCDGKMLPLTQERLLPADTARMIAEIYRIAGTRESASLERTGDDDFSFSLADVSRFRCNAYRQRGTLAAVLRVVPFGLPDPATLHIPPEVMALSEMRRGLVLVTGSAGSGKSTTLACLIDRIDRTRSEHIITIEDPIEFLYPHRKSIVSQREVAHDTETFQTALRASLRQAPDVILLGEMRDYETISTALTAAETGHLLFSTLHTVGAAKTIDRLIDVFPAEQQLRPQQVVPRFREGEQHDEHDGRFRERAYHAEKDLGIARAVALRAVYDILRDGIEKVAHEQHIEDARDPGKNDPEIDIHVRFDPARKGKGIAHG